MISVTFVFPTNHCRAYLCFSSRYPRLPSSLSHPKVLTKGFLFRYCSVFKLRFAVPLSLGQLEYYITYSLPCQVVFQIFSKKFFVGRFCAIFYEFAAASPLRIITTYQPRHTSISGFANTAALACFTGSASSSSLKYSRFTISSPISRPTNDAST